MQVLGTVELDLDLAAARGAGDPDLGLELVAKGVDQLLQVGVERITRAILEGAP